MSNAAAKGPPIRFGVSVTGLTKLEKDLRNVSKDLSRGLTAELRAAVAPVVSRAKENAAFSTKIPKSIRVASTGGRAKVRIQVKAGGARAPDAEPFEHMGKPGTFRHPVFGHRSTWVAQEAHPFLFPALVSEAPAIETAVGEALDRFLSANGL